MPERSGAVRTVLAFDFGLQRIGVAVGEVVDDAITGAHRANTESWRDLAPGRRAEILFAIARSIREHTESLAQLESRNIGKPIADARDEAGLGARVFEYYAGAISRFGGQTIPVARGGFDFTLRQSMGVIAAIVPWNFPFPIFSNGWKIPPFVLCRLCLCRFPKTYFAPTSSGFAPFSLATRIISFSGAMSPSIE